jgi:hypothetical protein
LLSAATTTESAMVDGGIRCEESGMVNFRYDSLWGVLILVRDI